MQELFIIGKVKKLIATVDINYNESISSITHPYMSQYAKKIGADFVKIKNKKFNNFPNNYEKFQIFELSENYDWTFLIDSDAIIHPNCPDLTDCADKDSVVMNAYDLYPIRFKHNIYTKRYKKNIGATTWFTLFSDWTRDLWKPYDDPLKYLDQITLSNKEKNFGYEPQHILDDYLVSLNIAKYGLNVKTVMFDLFSSYPKDKYPLFFFHTYCIDEKDKLKYLSEFDKQIKLEQKIYEYK